MQHAIAKPRRRIRGRRLVGAPVIAIIAALGLFTTAAFAYWLYGATGAGTATEPVGQVSTQTLTVTVGQVAAPVISGGPAQPFQYTIASPSTTPGPVDVTSVTGKVTATSVSGCLPTWFTVATPAGNLSVNLPATVQPNTSISGSGTLSMPANPATDQTLCTGASVTIEVDVA